MLSTKQFPDTSQQGIRTGLSQVFGLDLGGVLSPSGSSDTDHMALPFETARDQQGLVSGLVDRVDDHIVRGLEKFRSGLGREECGVCVDGACGMNGVDAFSQDLHLGVAYGRIERVDLTVGVADADLIEIDERQAPDAGAGERFGGP